VIRKLAAVSTDRLWSPQERSELEETVEIRRSMSVSYFRFIRSPAADLNHPQIREIKALFLNGLPADATFR
jgi:hypothetical protein